MCGAALAPPGGLLGITNKYPHPCTSLALPVELILPSAPSSLALHRSRPLFRLRWPAPNASLARDGMQALGDDVRVQSTTTPTSRVVEACARCRRQKLKVRQPPVAACACRDLPFVC